MASARIDARASGSALEPRPHRDFPREPAQRDQGGRGVDSHDRGLIDRARKRRSERQRQAGRQGGHPGIIRLHRGGDLNGERRPASGVEQPRHRDRGDAVEHEIRDLEIARDPDVIEVEGRERGEQRAGERHPSRLDGPPAARSRGEAIDDAAEQSEEARPKIGSSCSPVVPTLSRRIAGSRLPRILASQARVRPLAASRPAPARPRA